MLNLYLIRHASAEDSHKRGDFFRELTPEGQIEAQVAAKILAPVLKHDSAIVSSSAPRALQTALNFAIELQLPPTALIQSKKLYTAQEPEEYYEIIHDFELETRNILVVGHNPVITRVVKGLSPVFPLEMCKAAVLGFKVRVSEEYITTRSAELIFCYYPKKVRL